MKKKVYSYLVLATLLFFSCSQKNYNPKYDFKSLASADGYILACGDNGLIATTKDLKRWDYKSIDEDINFYDIASSNDLFYILGADSTGKSIIYAFSPGNGRIQAIECDEYYRQIKFVNGRLFVFTQNSIKLLNHDALWETISFPYISNGIRNIPLCMLFDGNNYVAAGGGNFIASSPDLSEWKFNADNAQGSGSYLGIASNKNRVVVVGDHLIIAIKDKENIWDIKTSGETINNIDSVADYYTLCLYDITTDGTRFVAVGQRGLVLVSQGDTWDISNSGTRDTLKKIVWNGKYFIALSDNGFFYSSDGQQWTSVK